jgi:hypothetical protein
MDVRTEMASLVRDVIAELIHAPVQVLTLNTNRATAEVKGRFRSAGVVYDYRIQGDNVTYRPMTASTAEAARADGTLDRRFSLGQR